MNTLPFLANRVGSIHYTGRIGKRSESCGRKASDPKPENFKTGRVAGLHLVSTHDQVSLPPNALPLKSNVQKGQEIGKYQDSTRQMLLRAAISNRVAYLRSTFSTSVGRCRPLFPPEINTTHRTYINPHDIGFIFLNCIQTIPKSVMTNLYESTVKKN